MRYLYDIGVLLLFTFFYYIVHDEYNTIKLARVFISTSATSARSGVACDKEGGYFNLSCFEASMLCSRSEHLCEAGIILLSVCIPFDE